MLYYRARILHMSDVWRILSLTDLHYESASRYQDEDKVQTPEAYRMTAFRNLHHLLKHPTSNQPFDAITIAGDITTAGRQAGFDRFLEKTMPCLSPLVRRHQAICVVPGNHDVKWRLDPALHSYFDEKFSAYTQFVKNTKMTSSLIPIGPVPTSDDHIAFADNIDGPLFIDHDSRLIVLCINSAMRCGEINLGMQNDLDMPLSDILTTLKSVSERVPNKENYTEDLDTATARLRRLQTELQKHLLFDIPYITPSQILELSNKLTALRETLGIDWPSYLRIAILHHHIAPFHQQYTEHKPFEVLADAAHLLDFLAATDFSIILTGHKHQPYVCPYKVKEKQLLIIGGPTVGGYIPSGISQGIRQLDVTRDGYKTLVNIADLRLDRASGIVDWNPLRYPKTHVLVEGIDAIHTGEFCFHALEKSTSAKSKTMSSHALEKQQSDEFFIFTNVVSCQNARSMLKDKLTEMQRIGSEHQISFWGMYDVYGRFDLVVRAQVKTGGHEAMKSLLKYLRGKDLLQSNYGGAHYSINVRDSVQFREGAAVPVAPQAHYDQRRSHKSFIVVPKGHADVNDLDIHTIKDKIEQFLQANPNFDRDHCALYWDNHHIIIEVLLKCGQYYDLCRLTRKLEEYVDRPEMQKMTHIVYHHEESTLPVIE